MSSAEKQDSALHDLFSKVISIKISADSNDDAAAVIELKDDLLELIGKLKQDINQKEADQFVQSGSHIHLLTFLFSECYDSIQGESAMLVHPLILCPLFSPHHSIDCLMTIWSRFVAEKLSQSKPGSTIPIADDVIRMTLKLLSDSSRFVELLKDIGSTVQSQGHCDRFTIDPRLQQRVRCIAESYNVFAQYLYLEPDTLSADECRFFRRRSFIQYLGKESLSLVIGADTKMDTENELRGTALLWSTLCRIGLVDTVNEVLVDHLEWKMRGKVARTVIEKCSEFIGMMAKCPCFEKWFESFLIAFSRRNRHSVSRVDSIRLTAHLLHKVLDNESMESQIQYLLGHKLIVRKTLPLHCVDYVVALLSYTTDDEELSENDCVMIDTISSIGAVWQRDSFVQTASMHRHRYLTRALVLLIRFILERLKAIGKAESTSEAIPFLLSGVQSRFNSERVDVRRLGMLVAEQYSKVVPGAEELNFGADLRNVFAPKNNDEAQCCDLEDEVLELTRAVRPNRMDYQLECLQENDECDSKEQLAEDGRDTVSDSLRRNDAENMENEKETSCVWSSDDDENEDGTELKRQSLSDDEEDLRKVPLPSYIGPLVDLLNSKDKPDEVESGLIAASALIRNVPSDLVNYSVGLCRTLLHLQNQYGITDFAVHKRKALVSLIVCCPRTILPMLPQQLYTKEWSVGVKLEILTVIVDAAREMSSLSTEHSPSQNGHRPEGKQSIALGHNGAEKERWRVIDARVAAKTKRWASRPKHVPNKENKFAKYAVMVVSPLLIGYHENESFLEEWPALHSRILFVMGCCVECSGRFGVGTLSISRDILRLILTLYCDHKLPELRRAALFVLSRILLHIAPPVLMAQGWFTNELNGIVHQLVRMAQDDTDLGTRDLCKLCLSQLKTAVDETQPSRDFL